MVASGVVAKRRSRAVVCGVFSGIGARVWLSLYSNASTGQTRGDEGVGAVALRNGECQFLLDCAPVARQRCRGIEVGTRRGAETAHPGSGRRNRGGDAG